VAGGDNRPPRAQRWPRQWPPALRTAEAFTLRQTASEPRDAVKAIGELADGVADNQTAEPWRGRNPARPRFSRAARRIGIRPSPKIRQSISSFKQSLADNRQLEFTFVQLVATSLQSGAWFQKGGAKFVRRAARAG